MIFLPEGKPLVRVGLDLTGVVVCGSLVLIEV
jgi:hypothetical protein